MFTEKISKNLDLLADQGAKGTEALGERSQTLFNLSMLTLLNGQFGSGIKFLGYSIEVKSLQVINTLIQAGEARLPAIEQSIDALGNDTIDFLESHPNFSLKLARVLGIRKSQ